LLCRLLSLPLLLAAEPSEPARVWVRVMVAHRDYPSEEFLAAAAVILSWWKEAFQKEPEQELGVLMVAE